MKCILCIFILMGAAALGQETCKSYPTADGSRVECETLDGWYSYAQCDSFGNCTSGSYQKTPEDQQRDLEVSKKILESHKSYFRHLQDAEREQLAELCNRNWNVRVQFDQCVAILPTMSRDLPTLRGSLFWVLPPADLWHIDE